MRTRRSTRVRSPLILEAVRPKNYNAMDGRFLGRLDRDCVQRTSDLPSRNSRWDDWKCPSQAQFAEFLRRSDARRAVGAPVPESLAGLADFLRQSESAATGSQSETGVGFLSHGSPHPLWDRELDI